MTINFLHVPVIFNLFKVPAPVHKNFLLAPAVSEQRAWFEPRTDQCITNTCMDGRTSFHMVKSLLGNYRLRLQLQFDLPKDHNFVLLIQYFLVENIDQKKVTTEWRLKYWWLRECKPQYDTTQCCL